MSTYLVKEAIQKYKELIKGNPGLANDIEKVLYIASFLLSGRFDRSQLISELIYSLSNLLNLIHDIILRKATNIRANFDRQEVKLKAFLTVIEYVEVFIELSARHLFGITGKWVLVTVLQVTKAIIRLIILFKSDEPHLFLPLRRDEIPVSQRSTVAVLSSSSSQCTDELTPSTSSTAPQPPTITLKRSSRVMRTLNATPSRTARNWRLPPVDQTPQLPTKLNDKQKFAEVLHIMRPLVHLLTMSKYGVDSWAPYTVALAMDLTSVQILRDPSTSRNWNHKERLEISFRTISLLLYALRSPFFDRYSKKRILSLLKSMSDNLPLVRFLFKPLIAYLPEWQKIYFYTWS